jgi:hypothetical protein
MHAAPAHAARKRSCPSSAISLQEDWTKVSDLAERRRIQNRIAQRNYRKKLKKRLEDLVSILCYQASYRSERHTNWAAGASWCLQLSFT